MPTRPASAAPEVAARRVRGHAALPVIRARRDASRRVTARFRPPLTRTAGGSTPSGQGPVCPAAVEARRERATGQPSQSEGAAVSKKSARLAPPASNATIPAVTSAEALQTLSRACEAAWDDLARARRRVLKLLQRYGGRASPRGEAGCTPAHLDWLARQPFEHSALQIVVADHVEEVRHAAERVARLDRAIDEIWARAGGARRSRPRALTPPPAAPSTSAATPGSRRAPRSSRTPARSRAPRR